MTDLPDDGGSEAERIEAAVRRAAPLVRRCRVTAEASGLLLEVWVPVRLDAPTRKLVEFTAIQAARDGRVRVVDLPLGAADVGGDSGS